MSDVLKAKKVKAWLITTICVMAFLIVFTILANTILYPAAIQFLGNPRPILVGGIEGTYYKSFDSKDEARANAEAVNEAICEEGFVLLKNQNGALPLAAGAKISVFGKNSARIVTGGSGSGAGTGEYEISLYDALSEEGFSLNPELMAFYKDNGKSGGGRSSNPVMDNANDGVAFLDAGETPQSSYTDAIRNSYSQYKD
ncbi:MAG: glycoside hydrolase family 3 C-terminal domain-containing protein, partial [Clostridiales bacterium]|nr:glycoside hydrolase family 3 C-terminal domain-containing protein [Clostridiales bacterium]